MSCLYCALPDLLEASMPPDPELVDLIEWAFLDGQIDGFALDLAHIFLINHARQPSAQLPH
jgi:hypothetical protein